MTKNGTIAYRVEQLEKNYNALDSKIEQLLTNDLPHLKEEMISLKTRVAVSTAINVGTVLLVGLFIYLLKV